MEIVLKVNIDCGTIIANRESVQLIADDIGLVNHVHISEPNLMQIEKRDLHNELATMLRVNGYDKYVSVEIKNLSDVRIVKDTAKYIKEIFE